MIRHYLVTECGWVRKPDYDDAMHEVWEAPDGQLYRSVKGHVPTITKVVPKLSERSID